MFSNFLELIIEIIGANICNILIRKGINVQKKKKKEEIRSEKSDTRHKKQDTRSEKRDDFDSDADSIFKFSNFQIRNKKQETRNEKRETRSKNNSPLSIINYQRINFLIFRVFIEMLQNGRLSLGWIHCSASGRFISRANRRNVS